MNTSNLSNLHHPIISILTSFSPGPVCFMTSLRRTVLIFCVEAGICAKSNFSKSSQGHMFYAGGLDFVPGPYVASPVVGWGRILGKCSFINIV